MSKIIKTTTGEAAFVMEETFESEDKATEGTEPLSQEVKEMEVKIHPIGIKLNQLQDLKTVLGMKS